MRLRGLPVVACALFAPGVALAQPVGPVETTVKHYDASRAHRCKEAWNFYSEKMQRHIRAESTLAVRDRQGSPAEDKPEEYRCWKDPSYKRLDARLVKMEGERATVAVKMRGRISQRRYDIVGKMTEWTDEVALVREGGAWKIDGPRPKEAKQAGDRLNVQEVRVTIRPPNEVSGHQVLEAMAISHISRDVLDAVLRDPKAWAAVLPSFKAIEPLEWTGKVGRARLAFADPSTPIPVTLRLSASPSHPTAGFTSFFWDVEQQFKAPVYMRGDWFLGTQSDGTTHVKLTIVIDPRHWPGSERMFSAERLANSLLDLEKAALKR